MMQQPAEINQFLTCAAHCAIFAASSRKWRERSQLIQRICMITTAAPYELFITVSS